MSELVARCLDHGPREGPNPTAIGGLEIFRCDAPTPPAEAVYQPSVFLVAQGRKETTVGNDLFTYDPSRYLVTSVPLPVRSEIVRASREAPFLSVAIRVELEVVRELVGQAGDSSDRAFDEPLERGLASCPVTEEIRDVSIRLVRLLDAAEDIPVLGPLYLRELLHHVLRGPRGNFLRAVAMGRGRQGAIADILAAVHADCARTFTVPDLAASAAMSESVFYEAFRDVTGASPIQYIKNLRLQEARRRLTLGVANVSGAARDVGYRSLSQFSRDFKRLFGVRPSSVLRR